MQEEGKYNIKAVSQLLGIQPGTLRAWERRYQFIEPVRNESGHRLYTERHLKILKWLIDKTEKGFTISQAVSLLESSDLFDPEITAIQHGGEQTKQLAEELLEALLQFNENKAHMLISQAFSLFTVEKAIVEVLGSILVQIGDKWESGAITSAHEHFASSILKSRISSVMHTIPTGNFMPKALAVCAPGEKHELGLLIFTIFLKRKGFETIYLGESVASDDLYTVMDIVKPSYLFMSCSLKEHLPETYELIDRLRKNFPDLKIGLGGGALADLPEEIRRKYEDVVMGASQLEWESWLNV